MLAREITSCRKNGELDKALQLSEKALLTHAKDVWVKRATAWVYYDISKTNELDNESFINCLNKIIQLKLDQQEDILWSNCLSTISVFIFKNINTKKCLENNFRNEITSIITKIPLHNKDKEMSFIMRAFLRMHKLLPSVHIVDMFFLWHKYNKPLDENFFKTEYQNIKIMSLVENIYISVAKQIDYTDTKTINKFIPILECICISRPEYLYTHYYLAKMFIKINMLEHGLKVFMPFAIKKNNEFWVWQIMAEFHKQNSINNMYMLAKAYTCNTKPMFKVKLLEQLAIAMSNNEKYIIAASVLKQCIDIRKKEKWNIPFRLEVLAKKDWYIKHSHKIIPQHEIKIMAKQAEDLFWSNCNGLVAIVAWVDKQNNRAKLIWDKEKSKVINTSKYNCTLIPLTCCKIIIDTNNTENIHIIKVLPTHRKVSEDVFVVKSLVLEKINNNKFAFADGNYIAASILKGKNINNGDTVKLSLLFDFNKNKDKYMWNVVGIM